MRALATMESAAHMVLTFEHGRSLLALTEQHVIAALTAPSQMLRVHGPWGAKGLKTFTRRRRCIDRHSGMHEDEAAASMVFSINEDARLVAEVRAHAASTDARRRSFCRPFRFPLCRLPLSSLRPSPQPLTARRMRHRPASGPRVRTVSLASRRQHRRLAWSFPAVQNVSSVRRSERLHLLQQHGEQGSSWQHLAK